MDQTQVTSFSDVELTEVSGEDNKAFEKGDSYSTMIEVPRKAQAQKKRADSSSSESPSSNNDYEDLDVEKPEVETGGAEEPEKINPILKVIVTPIEELKKLTTKFSNEIGLFIKIFLALGVTAYMVAAMARNFDRAVTLLVIWSLTVGYMLYAFFRNTFGNDVAKMTQPFFDWVDRNMRWIKWVFILVCVAGIATWIGVDTSKRPQQLISGGGYLVFIFGLFITSKHPNRVRWRPILWGGLIQICFGLFILRTEAGFQAFNWAGNIAQTFINYVDAGVEFVYGPNWADHSFAFKTLSVVLYFSSFISILYHFGVMQWLILKLGWLMQITLSTSATESMVAAGNIFVGQTESPLLIRPYIKDLTNSELFSVMVCGFGTIAGSVLGAYLGFGIQPLYVITACVMAAPCALAVAKLQYPETQKSKFSDYQDLELESSAHSNFIEAAFSGVSAAIPLVLNIGANLIAFLGLLAALNGVLSWFGGLLDFPELSFELICSYIFLPVTYLMGVEWVDCFKAAELIGAKLFLTEFIAYEELSEMMNMRDNGTVPKFDPVTGDVNWVDERTEAIVTYALCGFANFGSIGIMLGGLGSMAPERQGEMSGMVFRAMICGTFVSILNASIAGFLYVPREIDCTKVLEVESYEDWAIEEDRLIQCCQPLFGSDTSSDAKTNCCSYLWQDYDVTCV